MILNLFSNKTEDVKDNKVHYFLVDYENVNDKGLNGLEYLKRGDALYIFHNDTTSKMTIEMAHTLFNLPEIGITVENVQVTHTGKNAVDMILAATLGMLVASTKESHVCIHIISKDKGLCSLIENIPAIASNSNSTTTFEYQKASSIEECFVEKKKISRVRNVKKKITQKENKVTPAKSKKAVSKKEVEEKKATSKPKKKTTPAKAEKKAEAKSNNTKQEKSNQLQHNDEYKKEINNLRKKLIEQTSLDADTANKLANSLTGVIVKNTSVETKMKNYMKDLGDKEKEAVTSLKSDIKKLIEKY